MTTEHTPPPWRFDPYSDNVSGQVRWPETLWWMADGIAIDHRAVAGRWNCCSQPWMDDVDDGICTIYVPVRNR